MLKATAHLTILKRGYDLAIRIPAVVARSARLSVGQQVPVSDEDGGFKVRSIGMPKLSLAQKLARFDPTTHRVEVMATDRVGFEQF
jgi:antitoxin MazE